MNISTQASRAEVSFAAWFLALVIPVATILLGCLPALSTALQWDRGAWNAVPVPWHWQWFTAHLTHWSWGHLVWDLGAFIVLSVMCLRLAPRRYATAVLLAALLIPLEVRLFEPQFVTYRGLSGLDSALFGLLVASLWRAGSKSPAQLAPRLLALTGTLGLVGKAGFELVTGTTLFAPAEPGLYLPVPSAHLTGFAAGVIAGFPVFSSMLTLQHCNSRAPSLTFRRPALPQ